MVSPNSIWGEGPSGLQFSSHCNTTAHGSSHQNISILEVDNRLIAFNASLRAADSGDGLFFPVLLSGGGPPNPAIPGLLEQLAVTTHLFTAQCFGHSAQMHSAPLLLLYGTQRSI